MDRWEILIPSLICNVNQSNEQTWLWFRVVFASRPTIQTVRLYWLQPQHLWFETSWNTLKKEPLNEIPTTVWKVSKYGVFSAAYFPVFSPNTGKYGPEKTTYLDTFYAVNSKILIHAPKLKPHWKIIDPI